MDDSPPTQRDPWVHELAMKGPVETLNIIKRLKLFPRKVVPPKTGRPVTPGSGIMPPKENPPKSL